MFKNKIIKTKDIYLTNSSSQNMLTQEDLNNKYNIGFVELERKREELERELEKTNQILGSLLKYLDFRVKRENIPDPSVLPPEHPTISVLSVYKNKKK
jgi:hypothetical protein